MGFPTTLEIAEPVLEIARKLDRAGYEVWCVGGVVRDALLGSEPLQYDLGDPIVDLATSATPEVVQGLFRKSVAIGIKYGTVGVFDSRGLLHEVTTFRRDVETDGRHAVIAYGVSLEDDLGRRDFTINAIAYHPLRHEWRDPFGGAADLTSRVVRAVGDPSQRFQEDYLRILRAVRFAARFDFTIDPPTWEAARTASPGLTQLSAERVRDEWFKSLRTARSLEQLSLLWRSVGAAQAWIPELEGGTTKLPVPSPPPDARDPVLLTALLCRQPAAILHRLKASNAEIDRAAAIEKGPERPGATDQRSVRHWLAHTGSAADDLSSLWALRNGTEPPWLAAVREIRGRRDPLTRSDLAITGADLQAMGLRGPQIGHVLGKLLGRVLDEPHLNTHDALLTLARQLA
ncbi:MAG TPA: CCA tRNA nucleotidyltransferase [Gemmatimonadales bacterium]|nr:CCA tRNA nucleotidyltransferase [Gemmatimonadales bacterium]